MPSSNGLRAGARTRLRLELPPERDAPTQARRALSRLDGVDDETLEDARLVVSELVANSVRHAGLGTDDRIRLEVENRRDAVRIEVVDPGRGFEPNVPERGPLHPSGWGLYLVERLASEWGVASEGQTRVWCEIERRARRSA